MRWSKSQSVNGAAKPAISACLCGPAGTSCAFLAEVGFRSGQTGQTVNLLATPSMVRTHPPPFLSITKKTHPPKTDAYMLDAPERSRTSTALRLLGPEPSVYANFTTGAQTTDATYHPAKARSRSKTAALFPAFFGNLPA